MGSSFDGRVLDDHSIGRTASPEVSVDPAIRSVIVAV
jgi:hypothetical protein